MFTVTICSEGRTETVRPVTLESCAFVRAMDDASASGADRVKLFREFDCR